MLCATDFPILCRFWLKWQLCTQLPWRQESAPRPVFLQIPRCKAWLDQRWGTCCAKPRSHLLLPLHLCSRTTHPDPSEHRHCCFPLSSWLLWVTKRVPFKFNQKKTSKQSGQPQISYRAKNARGKLSSLLMDPSWGPLEKQNPAGWMCLQKSLHGWTKWGHGSSHQIPCHRRLWKVPARSAPHLSSAQW